MKRFVLLLLMLLPLEAVADGYCNNPIPPCDPNDPASSCYKPPDPPPKCEPKECDKCTKSPCYVGSGVYAFDTDDLQIGTTGFPIAVSRLYQSSHTIDGENGIGWTSSLSARLYYAVFLRSAPSTYQREADIRLTNGVLYRFVENADGSYTPPEGRFDTLVRNGDGTWDLWLQRTRSRFHFSATGNLLEIVDDYGNVQTWTYVSDRLQRVEDSSGSGRYVDVTYGADGRISDVTDLTGRTVHYTYNASGVMTSVTSPAGQLTSYSYGNGKYVPLLTSITDHWNRNISTITYDAQDRVRSYTDAGETYTYTYNYSNNPSQTSKADSSGNTWIYTFGSGGLVTGAAPPGGGTGPGDTYYANGLVQMQTDAVGVKTYFTWNARGNPLTIIEDYQGPTAVEWRYTYDPNFPDKIISYKPYVPGTSQIHADWQGAQFEYYQAGSNAPGAIYKVYRLANDGVTTRLVFTYTYDTHGRQLTATDALGNVTEYGYDAAGNRTSLKSPSNNDAGTQPILTYAYDVLGRPTSVTDARGFTTTATYDVLDRTATLTLPKPSASSTLTFTTTFHHDEYDAATQLLFTRVVDANGRTTRAGADQYGQFVRTVDEAGTVTRAVYTKGLLTSSIDANNYTTSYAYDARRRLTTTTFPDGTTELATYNADNTIATLRDRANQTVSLTYDRHKRKLTKTYPNGGVITRTYQGQKLVQVSDTFASPSETFLYSYDNWFRVVSETQASRGTVTRTYDLDDRPATMAVAGGATVTYAYYPNRTIRTIAWSPVSGTFKYDYDLNGKTQSVTFPNGQTRTYAYDDQGRIAQVATTHPVAGALASFSYGYDVDAFSGQPTQLGLRTTVTSSVPALGLANATTQFGYDARGQLTQATYPSGAPFNGLTQTWTYDALGNRVTAVENGVSSTLAYSTIGSNPLLTARLQSDGGNAYTYDAKGNTTARSGTRGNFTFSYDYENRLRSVNGDLTAGYLYDYIGRRSLKTVSGASTTYVYNRRHAIAEGGASPAEYLFGSSFDEALAMVRGGQVYYYGVDALGSVATVNDAAGSVQDAYAWDAFGVARAQVVNVANPIGFTGRELAEAGRLYYRARYYEPAVGRFDREDPLAWKDPLGNLYRYVVNLPTMLIDPQGTGHQWSPALNCDPVPYLAAGEPEDGAPQQVLIIPPNIPVGPTPSCTPTPPWWDVDFICTDKGWVKVKGPSMIVGGHVIGWKPKPPWNWKPLFPCPPKDPKCPAAPPPPSGPPGHGGPPGVPSIPPMGPLN